MHPYYLELLGSLGTIMCRLGKYVESLKIHERCERLNRIIKGETNGSYLNSLERIAGDLSGLGKHKDALLLI